MREILKADLSALKIKIQDAEKAVFVDYTNLQTAKRNLQSLEDDILMDKVADVKIDGKNAEIRAAQMREATASKRDKVGEVEFKYEAKKLALSNLRTELQINLALVELIKGVA